VKTIIGFDSWTGGARYFGMLVSAFEAKGFNLKLIHLGSWGNDRECEDEFFIGKLLVRDISYYKSNSLEHILEVEKPSAVILLSTDTFAHRAFIRYCKKRSIPTLNLYHGLVGLTEQVSGSAMYAVARIAHLRNIFSKLRKLLRHTLPCYIEALVKTNAKTRDWKRFYLDIYYMAKNDNFFRSASDDSRTNKCAVHVQADVVHAMNFYKFPQEDIFVVGNPDLNLFGFVESMIGKWAKPDPDERLIMYIETGFSSVGLFYSSEEDFVNHLIITSKALAQQGYKMCIKLKPHGSNVRLIEQRLKLSGIHLVENNTFIDKLMTCSACIVETTSLAMIPAMLGMPLLLAQYGRLKSLGFGSMLKAYPRSYFLYDLSNIRTILEKDLEISNSTKLFEWIYLNAGSLPPKKMPERVAAVIEKMITNTKVV
jgi:hypothetical protein